MEDVRVKEVMRERDVPVIKMKKAGTSEQHLRGEQYTYNNYANVITFHT